MRTDFIVLESYDQQTPTILDRNLISLDIL